MIMMMYSSVIPKKELDLCQKILAEQQGLGREPDRLKRVVASAYLALRQRGRVQQELFQLEAEWK